MNIDSRLKPIIGTLQANGYDWVLVGIVPTNGHRTVEPKPRWVRLADWIPHGRALVEMGCNGDGQPIEFYLDELHPEHGACVRERFLSPQAAQRAEAKRAIWPVRKELP